jgi:hypothetical protein
MSALNRWLAQGEKPWLRALIGVVLFLLLFLDAYAIHQVYGQRAGNALDYYPFWAGGREVLLHQRNPYRPEVMLSIQQAIYGRPALPDENQHGYAYPAYAPFIVSPFLALPFPVSASLWIAIQQFLLVASVVLVVRATHWPIGPWRLLLLCLAAMIFRYAMIAFVLGQTSTWVLFSLSLALWAATRRRSGLAGLALAAGLIKPQLVLLPALALLVTLQPGRRLRLVLSLGGATAVLLVCSWLFAGFWMGDYWQLLQAYQGYSTTQFPIVTLAQTWLSPAVSQILNLVALGGLLALYAVTLWRARGSGRVVLPVAMAVVVTQLLVPQTGSYNLTLLVLPAVVALQRLDRVQIRGHWIAFVGRVTVWASLVIVPWVLLPVVEGQSGIPLDVVLLPALILLALVGAGHRKQPAA